MQNVKKIPVYAVLMLLIMALGHSPAALAQGFPDLDGHWAATEVNAMSQKGIVSGYPDGNFYPNKSISRRELTSIVFSVFPAAKKIDRSQVATYPDYPDLQDGWGLADLQTGVFFLPGYTDGYFRPDEPATRYDVALLSLVAAMIQEDKYQLAEKQLFLEYSLADSASWEKMVAFKEFAALPEQYKKTTAYLKQDPDKNNFYSSASFFYSHLNPVALLVGQDILKGFADGSLGLNKEVSRAEAVVIVSRMQRQSFSDSNQYLVEPAGMVLQPHVVAATAQSAETSLTQVGKFFQEKYSDPVQRGRMLHNLLLHTFSYDWDTREGLKDYTYADLPGLMNTGLGTDQGLTLYYSTLAEKAGLKARVIKGQSANNGEQGNHTWIELTMDNGGIISVDPTYGVCTGELFYHNFPQWENKGYQWTK